MTGRRLAADSLVPAVTVVGVVAVWEIVTRAFHIPRFIMPPPSAILAEGWAWRYHFIAHTWVTLYETLGGFALSIAVGVPLAVLIVYSPALKRALYPLIVLTQSVPKIAIAPLLIFWAGLGLFPKVLVAFLISFFPIIIDTVVGLRSVEPEMLHLARSMGAGAGRTFLKIRFPSALPNIFAGLKVAVTLAVVGAIVGEFIQADRGLGYALLQANAVMDTRLGFAAIIVLSAVGIAMFVAVDMIERRLIPWHASHRSELATGTRLELKMISSRGTKVYPPTGTITDTLDHWRCRFIIREDPGDLWDEDVHQLLARISRRHTWMHTEKLQEFDGELGFTRDQGEN